MDILDILKDETADWQRYPPISEEALDAFIRQTGLSFPGEYLTLLRYSNGGDGQLGAQPCWFIITPVEDLTERNEEYHAQVQVYIPKEGYQIQEWLPGYFFVFGTNGDSDLLVFNTQEEQPWKVYYVPMIHSSEDIRQCTPDFRTFIELMGRPGIDGLCE
jgi:hypothetical protein